MKIIMTAPLRITTLSGRTIELLPVPMANGFPSGTIAPWNSQWSQFLKHGGQQLPCDGKDIHRVQAYMRQHGTEALSENGEVAFTVSLNNLVECRPEVCGEAIEQTHQEESACST